MTNKDQNKWVKYVEDCKELKQTTGGNTCVGYCNKYGIADPYCLAECPDIPESERVEKIPFSLSDIDFIDKDAQKHIDKQIKEAQIEILENIRAICKSKIRNSDDWRTMADEIEKMVDGL